MQHRRGRWPLVENTSSRIKPSRVDGHWKTTKRGLTVESPRSSALPEPLIMLDHNELARERWHELRLPDFPAIM